MASRRVSSIAELKATLTEKFGAGRTKYQSQQLAALDKVCELLFEKPETLIADQMAIEARVEQMKPYRATYGLKVNSTWYSFRNAYREAFRQAPTMARLSNVKRKDYTPAWQALFERLARARDLTITTIEDREIAILAGWCNANGIAPEEFSQEHFNQILDERRKATKSTRDENPRRYARNYMAAIVPWTKLHGFVLPEDAPVIVSPTAKRNGYLPITEYHQDFQDEVQELKRFYETGRRPGAVPAPALALDLDAEIEKALASGGLFEQKHQVLAYDDADIAAAIGENTGSKHVVKGLIQAIKATANAMVCYRGAPFYGKPQAIRSLEQLACATGIIWLKRQHDDRVGAGICKDDTVTLPTRVRMLRIVATKWLGRQKIGSTPVERAADVTSPLGQFDHICHRMCIALERTKEMSPRRRQAVDELMDNNMLSIWLTLPQTLLAELKIFIAARRAAKLPISAVEIAKVKLYLLVSLASDVPFRVKNFALLRFRGSDATLILRKTKAWSTQIVAPRTETKNKSHNAVDLCETSEELLDLWLTTYRAKHIEHWNLEDNAFLFPGNGTIVVGQRDNRKVFSGMWAPHAMGTEFSHLMDRRGIGQMTIHVARHIAATMMCRADSRLIPVAATFLGDKVETVRNFYVHSDTKAAQRAFLQIVARCRPDLQKRYGIATHDSEGFANAA